MNPRPEAARGPAPARPPRPAGLERVVAAARTVLERDSAGGLTMQAVASELRMQAPSLYKHVRGKRQIEVELLVDVLAEVGATLHAALGGDAGGPPIPRLLAAYRAHALAHPHLYRLATAGRLPRGELPEGLEDWAGEPFLLVTGDPQLAQALWSFAHGMVILELDGRFPPGSDLDATWAAGAAAFTARARATR